MKIIGITGSSGAGKSTVCDILKTEYDVIVINADAVAKKLSQKGTRYIEEIAKNFGNDILDEAGELKRKKLADIIYQDSSKRETLNQCTFPYICEEIKQQIKQIKDVSVVVIDAPLLFESKLNEMCHAIIGVIAERKLQIKRIMERDNLSEEEAKKRIMAQQPNSFYIKKCDDIVENNDKIADIEQEIRTIAKKYHIHQKLQ